MSMQPQAIPPIPQDTLEVAQAAFSQGNLYLQIRDELGVIYQDHDFVALFSHQGQPAQAPWQLILVCLMQFLENLSDRQAADAVRARIDWKYALSLPLKSTGFNFSVLSEFRRRLIASGQESELLNILLTHLKAKGLLKSPQRQRTDATHILATIRTLNRLELLGETVRAALNNLALEAPEWLAPVMQAEWFERYSRRIENYRLPKLDSERENLANLMGKDGFTLLEAIDAETTPKWLRDLPKILTLRRVWLQQFYAPDTAGTVCWRETKDLPPSSSSIHSPYDTEAQYSNKRNMNWVGYKVHLTETCDPDSPRLITHVHTTYATVPDNQVVDSIHEALAVKQLLPQQHFMDGGYLDAEHLVKSKTQYNIELIGPVREDHSWQAKAGAGFDASSFKINWEQKIAICPQGHHSTKWQPGQDIHGQAVIHVRFLGKTCFTCPVRSACTKSKKQPREITLRPQELYTALQERRQLQKTKVFKQQYDLRAGIESAHSQAIRRLGFRQTRYIGLAKTHLQHIFSAIALNLIRVTDWLDGVPLAQTRSSSFTRIMKPLVA